MKPGLRVLEGRNPKKGLIRISELAHNLFKTYSHQKPDLTSKTDSAQSFFFFLEEKEK